MSKKIIIIDSIKGERFLDADNSRPSSLLSVVDAPVLQWIGKAFNNHDLSGSIYIGGYHIEKVISNFPKMQYRYHDSWQDKGELSALLMVLRDLYDDCIIIRGSTVLLKEGADVLLRNTAGFSKVEYEQSVNKIFAGIICIKKENIPAIITSIEYILQKKLTAGIEELLEQLDDINTIDLSGLAALAYDDVALRKIIFKGKAQTLEQLSDLVKNAVVLDPFKITVEHWRNNSTAVVRYIQNIFSDGYIVIRSSTESEDTLDATGAGFFHSELDVQVASAISIENAINNVVSSYSKNGRIINQADNVLIQRQVENVVMSGVLFTNDLSTGAPYFVVNLERGSGRSDVVTSGTRGVLETYYVSWEAENYEIPEEILAIIDLGKELVDLTGSSNLDIEYGEDEQGQLYLFQARPMPPCSNQMALEIKDHLDFISHTTQFVSERMKAVPWLKGSKTIFGNMSDWNPAEMIGTSPSPLALSLYQLLIGDEAWAKARARIGYQDLEGVPLILSVGGKPYVDVRASLNSLLPLNIETQLAERLIDTSLSILGNDTSLQDKIEFNVAITCLTPNWIDDCKRFEKLGVSKAELEKFKVSLRQMTQGILLEKYVTFDQLDANLDRMRERCKLFKPIEEESVENLSIKARLLLKDCIRFGVEPFSIYARFGFISMSFMNSFKNTGIFSVDDFDNVLQGIPTVASSFTRDIQLFKIGNMSLDELIAEYGHLRPNSYDITSYNYAESLESILRQSKGVEEYSFHDNLHSNDQVWKIFEKHKEKIEVELSKIEIDISSEKLFSFIQKSIIGREFAKFEFMRNLNMVMDIVIRIGKVLGISRKDLAYLKVDDILNLAHSSKSSVSSKRLERYIGYRKKRMELTKALRLPEVICSPSQLNAFIVESEKANFITSGVIKAPIVFLENANEIIDLADKIVLIEAADPGFDWIFSQPLAGLITQYGGAASHMAIRAAEFGIPAAIGCGSVLFEKVKTFDQATLDCANQQIGSGQCL